MMWRRGVRTELTSDCDQLTVSVEISTRLKSALFSGGIVHDIS